MFQKEKLRIRDSKYPQTTELSRGRIRIYVHVFLETDFNDKIFIHNLSPMMTFKPRRNQV